MSITELRRPPAASESLATIARIVAAYYHVPLHCMYERRRTGAIARARNVAIFLMRRRTLFSSVEIGEYMGDRDHSTILAAVESIRGRALNDDVLKGQLIELAEMLRDEGMS